MTYLCRQPALPFPDVRFLDGISLTYKSRNRNTTVPVEESTRFFLFVFQLGSKNSLSGRRDRRHDDLEQTTATKPSCTEGSERRSNPIKIAAQTGYLRQSGGCSSSHNGSTEPTAKDSPRHGCWLHHPTFASRWLSNEGSFRRSKATPRAIESNP